MLESQLLIPEAEKIKVGFIGICHECKHQHRETVDPWEFSNRAFDWFFKHRHHPDRVEVFSEFRVIPKNFDDREMERQGRAPWFVDYKANADIKLSYAADTQPAITSWTSLATSATWVAGGESASVDNSSNKYLDYKVSGKVTTGTTPTVDKEIRLYAVQPLNDTPNWPDVFDGTDSAETVSNTYILDKLPLIWSGSNNASSNITYPIVSALTLAQAFGIVPSLFSFFLAHSTAVNLNSTGSNHELSLAGVYATSI